MVPSAASAKPGGNGLCDQRIGFEREVRTVLFMSSQGRIAIGMDCVGMWVVFPPGLDRLEEPRVMGSKAARRSCPSLVNRKTRPEGRRDRPGRSAFADQPGCAERTHGLVASSARASGLMPGRMCEAGARQQ